ncbi:MAG: hypothetical protein WBR18_02275 [Anaerolineales bacterium]
MEDYGSILPGRLPIKPKEVKIVNEVSSMSETVGDMTREELRQMLDAIVEQRLMDLLGDPDEGLELRAELRRRLLEQQEEVAAGERGRSLEDIKQELEIE